MVSRDGVERLHEGMLVLFVMCGDDVQGCGRRWKHKTHRKRVSIACFA